ncbi:MAG TPA: universal stress protein, partial [Bacteroidia bacterium]|nr:universal stress protein [Bacteroidia bacterium]
LYNNLVNEKKFNIKLESAKDAIKKAKLPYVKKVVNCHNVAVEAMKYSYEVRADLLVIMTDHEESRYSGFLWGSKHVINHSKVPVMSIKPTEYYVTGGMYSN